MLLRSESVAARKWMNMMKYGNSDHYGIIVREILV